jgi:hypothetical protein
MVTVLYADYVVLDVLNGQEICWLVGYCFTSCSRIFYLYGDVSITCEWLQNLGLCSALRAIEQGGIFIVPHLLWHGASVFWSHPKDCPIQSPLTTHYRGCREYTLTRIIQSPLTTHKGMWRTYSNPDPHGWLKYVINEYLMEKRNPWSAPKLGVFVNIRICVQWWHLSYEDVFFFIICR